MEEGSEQAGRLVAWPCRWSDEGGSGGTAHTPPVPPPPPPEPLAPAPLPREKARRAQAASVGERQFLSLAVAAPCASLPLSEGETERRESECSFSATQN